MSAGRPAPDLKALAEDLLEWSTNPTAFNLIQFTRPRKMSVTMLPDYAAVNKEFSEALNLAKESIAMNRFEATLEGALPYADYAKVEGNYDPLHHRYFRNEKEFESSLRKKENESFSGDVYVVANSKLTSGADLRTKGIPGTTDSSSK